MKPMFIPTLKPNIEGWKAGKGGDHHLGSQPWLGPMTYILLTRITLQLWIPSMSFFLSIPLTLTVL